MELLSSVPAILFALRVWAGACLALYIAFWLQLDNAYWAATSAVIVSQPTLGASLRKAWFRMLGTLLGAVAIVTLTAWFAQNRIGFLIGLAIWGATCSFSATVLRNFAGYAAALAGFTAVIIASDELGAVGGASGQVFLLALTRVTEIWIGIVCAALVMTTTDLGRSRRRLAGLLASLAAEITKGVVRSLAGAPGEEMRVNRRHLLRRTIVLDPVIDEVRGEAPDLRLDMQGLRAAIEGLFIALSSWRLVANHLEFLSAKQRRNEANSVLQRLPGAFGSTNSARNATNWLDEATPPRRILAAAVRAMVALPANTVSLRMTSDGAAQTLIGISRALDGVALLTGEDGRGSERRAAGRLPIPDYLPAAINGARTFFLISAVELFWILTEWPSGALAIVWSTIFVIIHSLPGADQPYATAKSRLLGISAASVFAAIVKFSVLPGSETFSFLAIAIGVVLMPAAALSDLRWQPAMFGFVALAVIPLLKPENPISYDALQYYNDALAIVMGAGASILAFRLIPPLSPAFRVARLLALTLNDLRRLIKRGTPQTRGAWENLVYARLSNFPEQAQPLQRARLLVALSVGSEVIRARRMARRFGSSAQLDAALEPLGFGRSALAREKLEDFANALSTISGGTTQAVLRILSSIAAISEGLHQHTSYFDARTVDELR